MVGRCDFMNNGLYLKVNYGWLVIDKRGHVPAAWFDNEMNAMRWVRGHSDNDREYFQIVEV